MKQNAAWCGAVHTGCAHGFGPEHCGECHPIERCRTAAASYHRSQDGGNLMPKGVPKNACPEAPGRGGHDWLGPDQNVCRRCGQPFAAKAGGKA